MSSFEYAWMRFESCDASLNKNSQRFRFISLSHGSEPLKHHPNTALLELETIQFSGSQIYDSRCLFHALNQNWQIIFCRGLCEPAVESNNLWHQLNRYVVFQKGLPERKYIFEFPAPGFISYDSSAEKRRQKWISFALDLECPFLLMCNALKNYCDLKKLV